MIAVVDMYNGTILTSHAINETMDLDNNQNYYFNWHGKSKACKLAKTPSTKILYPHKKESLNWDTTQNIFIEGDNLDALKLMQKSYDKKIKMIYIDPPYNKSTGKNYIIYNDNYKSDWLNMIYTRLILAQNLLSDNGIIFISIDDNEIANLKKICDEIFGKKNFISIIIIQSNKQGQHQCKHIAKCHEYLLIYSKSNRASLNELNKEKSLPFIDQYGPYDLCDLRNRNPKVGNQNLYYPIYIDPRSKNKYNLCNISLNQSELFTIEVFPKNSTGKPSRWRWSKRKVLKDGINIKPQVLFGKAKKNGGYNIYQKSRKITTKAKSIWTDTKVMTEQGTIELGKLGMGDLFGYPKPIELVKRCIQLATNKDELILDFFAGSSTTAHAVMQLNAEDNGERKFIMIQLPETCNEKTKAYQAGYKNIAEISKERIRRAAKMIRDENPNYNEDLGFRVYSFQQENF